MHTLKRFIQYYAPYKAVFFLDLVCAAIISLVDLAFPQILRTLTRTLFVKNASSIMRNLVPIGIVLFLIYVLQACCKYYVSYQGHMMGAYMERDMRQQLFDHYEKLSFPKSTCMLPAAHSSRTYPSRSGMPRFASRHRCT